MRTDFYLILLLVLFLSPLALAQEEEQIVGFSTESTHAQRDFEQNCIDRISKENIRTILHSLSSHTNLAGTDGDLQNADFVAEYLEQLGYKVTRYPYYVLLPHPIDNKIIINGDSPVEIIPGEKPVAGDDADPAKVIKPYNAFSPSAEVEAEVVYAHFGRKEDFDLLETMGIDVRNKIVLCRYGRIYRGSKVYQAEKRGALGVIFFSDPADDGYMRGDIYPRGPMRREDFVHRGSIYYMFDHQGDPLTPMQPALKDAKRLSIEEAGLPKIPAIPLGYGHAKKLLQLLDGKEVPQDWQGGLPLRYHIGPSQKKVRLLVKADFQIRKIVNVVAELPGTEYPDQWMLVGCHRDSWGYGTLDPHSGNGVMLEAARVIAETAAEHGGPKRSLLITSWDAEEFGIIGSVEWIEQMRDELGAKAVAYMNADSIISGKSFGASATPLLRGMLAQAIQDSTAPDGTNLKDYWLKQLEGRGVTEITDAIRYFGGGSDHVGFLHHVGVPCVGMGFWGKNGIYHSAYDSMNWMEKYGDPGFLSHSAAVGVMVRVLTRLTNAEILPFSPSKYPELFIYHWDKIVENHASINNMNAGIKPLLQEIHQVALVVESKLTNAIHQNTRDSLKAGEINSRLQTLARNFIDSNGMKDNPWNRNLCFASDSEDGYSMVVFPGLMAAIDHQEDPGEEIHRLKRALTEFKNELESIRELLMSNKN